MLGLRLRDIANRLFWDIPDWQEGLKRVLASPYPVVRLDSTYSFYVEVDPNVWICIGKHGGSRPWFCSFAVYFPRTEPHRIWASSGAKDKRCPVEVAKMFDTEEGREKHLDFDTDLNDKAATVGQFGG